MFTKKCNTYWGGDKKQKNNPTSSTAAVSTKSNKYCLLLRRKVLTLAVWADIVGGTYVPCQKYEALTLHNFSLCSPI
jgi:hypothetical protein